MRSPLATWKSLEASGAAVVYRPVAPADLSEAEAALGFAFPPSYVELVTSVGAPALSARAVPGLDLTSAWNLPYAVLTPGEAVQLTTDWRTSDVVSDPEMFDDPASSSRLSASLSSAVFFQLHDDPNDAFVFLVGSEGVEPQVADFAHDYLEELDWTRAPSADGPVWTSFATLTEHLAAKIRREVLGTPD
jgi:hypothetical protein